MDRIVYHLVHKNDDDRWHLTRTGGNESGVLETKDDAVAEGRLLCRAHVQHGDKAQLVVHRADGSIETEYTYGDDPATSPG